MTRSHRLHPDRFKPSPSQDTRTKVYLTPQEADDLLDALSAWKRRWENEDVRYRTTLEVADLEDRHDRLATKIRKALS